MNFAELKAEIKDRKRREDMNEVEQIFNDLDDELRTCNPYICDICNKQTQFWNRFMGFGSCYHKNCIDNRIIKQKGGYR